MDNGHPTTGAGISFDSYLPSAPHHADACTTSSGLFIFFPQQSTTNAICGDASLQSIYILILFKTK
jgi:hypothetical protein